MTKEKLKSYISMKEEIRERKEALKTLPKRMEKTDTILDYRTGFPIPKGITGVNRREYWREYNREICKIGEIERECEEVEQFITSIPDSLTRRIFIKHYMEGKKLKEISREIHLEKSSISKKISKFLQLSTNSTNSTL